MCISNVLLDLFSYKGKQAYYVGMPSGDVIKLIRKSELAPGRCLPRTVLAQLRAWRAPRRADSAGRAPAGPWRRHLVQELLLVLVEREQLEVEVQLPAGERGVEPAARGGGPGQDEDATEPREGERVRGRPHGEEEVRGRDWARGSAGRREVKRRGAVRGQRARGLCRHGG